MTSNKLLNELIFVLEPRRSSLAYGGSAFVEIVRCAEAVTLINISHDRFCYQIVMGDRKLEPSVRTLTINVRSITDLPTKVAVCKLLDLYLEQQEHGVLLHTTVPLSPRWMVRYVPVADAEAGMRIVKPIRAKSGVTLLEVGAVLSNDTINRLQARGFESLAVAESDERTPQQCVFDINTLYQRVLFIFREASCSTSRELKNALLAYRMGGGLACPMFQ